MSAALLPDIPDLAKHLTDLASHARYLETDRQRLHADNVRLRSLVDLKADQILGLIADLRAEKHRREQAEHELVEPSAAELGAAARKAGNDTY